MGKVVVDTDFLNHILKTPNGEEIMQKIVNFNGYELIMHPWVYDREIKGLNSAIEKYVNENVKILDYSDFLKTEEDEIFYDMVLRSLYPEMNRGATLDESYRSFKTYNKSGVNLGEIHSVILAKFFGIPLLLSDDYNAKEIAAKRINEDGYQLDVKKSFDVMCDMVSSDRSILTFEDANSVIKNLKPVYQKDYLKKIKALYID